MSSEFAIRQDFKKRSAQLQNLSSSILMNYYSYFTIKVPYKTCADQTADLLLCCWHKGSFSGGGVHFIMLVTFLLHCLQIVIIFISYLKILKPIVYASK